LVILKQYSEDVRNDSLLLVLFLFLLLLLVLLGAVRNDSLDALNAEILGDILQESIILEKVLELLLLLLRGLRMGTFGCTCSLMGRLSILDRHLESSLENGLLIFHLFLLMSCTHVGISLRRSYWMSCLN
jgi:hypothetical protein